ncbi:hypothetical protein [Bacillus cereus]|uniref:hypothetical protein n=1 Tax=Bacillus cereus TaxID=1396 RepID=UPI00380F5BA0
MDQLVAANEQPSLSGLTLKKSSLDFKEDSCKAELKDLMQEMDHELGSIGVSVATLEDVKVLLGHLSESMDTAEYKGEEMYYYRDHHRKIRVYWNLINHTVNMLNIEYEKADAIKDKIFKVVREGNEKQ